MTMPKDDMADDGVFRFFDSDRSLERETDTLSMVSRKLIEASEELRKRSNELRDEMMRTQLD